MKVKVEHRDSDGELLCEDMVELEYYCDKLYQDVIRILYNVETIYQSNDINISKDNFFQVVRHRLLDVAGGIKRLPNNLEGDEIEV